MSIDKENSKKNKKAKLSKKGAAKLIVIGLSIGVVCVSANHLAYKYVPGYEETLSTVSEEYSEHSFKDLVSNLSGVEQVYALESNMSLSSDLSRLNLDKYTEGLSTIDSSSYQDSDITNLITEFETLKTKTDINTPSNESRRFYEIALILKDYENRTSEVADDETLAAINAYSELLIKSLIIDSIKLDTASIDNISTNLLDLDNEFSAIYTDPLTGKNYKLNVSDNNNLNTLIKYTRELNKNIKGNKDKEGNVIETSREDIISTQKKLFNSIKLCLELGYTVDNGTIEQSESIFKCVQKKLD